MYHLLQGDFAKEVCNMAVHQGGKVIGTAKKLASEGTKSKAGNVLTNHKVKHHWFSDKDLQT